MGSYAVLTLLPSPEDTNSAQYVDIGCISAPVGNPSTAYFQEVTFTSIIIAGSVIIFQPLFIIIVSPRNLIFVNATTATTTTTLISLPRTTIYLEKRQVSITTTTTSYYTVSSTKTAVYSTSNIVNSNLQQCGSGVTFTDFNVAYSSEANNTIIVKVNGANPLNIQNWKGNV